MKLKITHYRKVNSEKTSIIAEVSILFTDIDLTLYKCKLVRGKEGQMFLMAPSEKYQDKATGETKYFPFWRVSKENSDDFQQEFLKALHLYAKEKDALNSSLDQLSSSKATNTPSYESKPIQAKGKWQENDSEDWLPF